jgi:hypothetical protein
MSTPEESDNADTGDEAGQPEPPAAPPARGRRVSEDNIRDAADWLRECVTGADGFDEFTKEEQDLLLKNADQLEKHFVTAMRLYEVRFADLPPVKSLRARWQARRLNDDDPVFLNMELQSITDARIQLVLNLLMDVIQSFAALAQIYARHVAKSAGELMESRVETQKLLLRIKQSEERMEGLEEGMKRFSRVLPKMTEVIEIFTQQVNTATLRGKAEFTSIVVGSAIIGGVVIAILIKVLG